MHASMHTYRRTHIHAYEGCVAIFACVRVDTQEHTQENTQENTHRCMPSWRLSGCTRVLPDDAVHEQRQGHISGSIATSRVHAIELRGFCIFSR